MSDADAQALVAYLNTLAPVRNPLPRTKGDRALERAGFLALAPRRFETPMPWSGLSKLTEADLRALYRYLRTI